MEVVLRFFEDDATGSWGLAHKNSIDIDTPFNAFWDGKMMFHDVFEHYFEDNGNKYFTGENAFNLAGEMVAAGHYAYYRQLAWEFEQKRTYTRGYSRGFTEDVNNFTIGSVTNAMYGGGMDYGYELKSIVPKQSDTNDYDFENCISEYQYIVRDYKIECTDPQERADAIRYKRSCTNAKIANLHRYGYKQAMKIAPWSERHHNSKVICGFIDYWELFTKHNEVERVMAFFNDVHFTWKTVDDKLEWDCHFKDKFTREFIQHKEVEDYMLLEHAYA